MAQIIKHRRGSINQIASVTANVGEFVIGTGSLGDLIAPVVFVGESAVAGGYNPISKIYQGTTAPDLTVGTWGSAINGLPFYSTSDQTLYILKHTGNLAIDLTGNIEGNVISGVTINNLTGTTINASAVTSSVFTGSFIGDGSGLTSIPASAVTGLELNRIAEGSVTASVSDSGGLQVNSNIFATGSISGSDINASGDVNVGGDLTIQGQISSSLIPSINDSFDLGSPTNAWNDLYVSGTAYIENIALDNISVNSISLPGNLIVSGTTTLSGSVTIEDNAVVNGNLTVTGSSNLNGNVNVTGDTIFNGDVTITGLTDNRVVIVGTGGILEDDANFTFDGNILQIGGGVFEVDVNDGDIRSSGSLKVDTLNVDNNLNVGGALNVTGSTSLYGNLFVSGNVEILGSASYVYISSSVVEIDDNIIRLNAYSPFERYAGFEVIDSGSSGVSASMLWDSLNDYWLLISSSGQSSKIIGTTAGTYGSEISLTTNTITKATGPSTIGNSLLTDDATTFAYNTNKFTVTASDGATLIAGNLTLSAAGGSDAGSNTSGILFKNSSNVIGFVSTTETTDVLDGILGYKQSDGALVFSTVIDGGTY